MINNLKEKLQEDQRHLECMQQSHLNALNDLSRAERRKKALLEELESVNVEIKDLEKTLDDYKFDMLNLINEIETTKSEIALLEEQNQGRHKILLRFFIPEDIVLHKQYFESEKDLDNFLETYVVDVFSIDYLEGDEHGKDS